MHTIYFLKNSCKLIWCGSRHGLLLFSHKVRSRFPPSACISFSNKTILANKKWELNCKAQRRLGEQGSRDNSTPSMTKVIFIVQEVHLRLWRLSRFRMLCSYFILFKKLKENSPLKGNSSSQTVDCYAS